MTLATRCSSCGTTFRVVQDQLRVSDGWVRCGRCDTVFDALEALVDVETDAATPAPASRQVRPQPPQAAADAAALRGEAREPIDIHRLLERQDNSARAEDSGRSEALDDLDDFDQAAAEPVFDAPGQPATETADHSSIAAAAPLEQAPAAEPAAGPESPLSPTQESPFAAAPPAAAAAVNAATIPKPAFLRHADRAERWNTPAMRAALLGSSLILLLMLTLQVVYHQRDAIAAHLPATAPLLHGACERWGCRIQAPRSIDDVAIESSSLSKIAGQPDAVRLMIALRNRGSVELALPAVELSLTDFQGKLISRRALLPNDFQIDPPNIAGGAELPLQLILSTGEQRVAGYTVELFYP